MERFGERCSLPLLFRNSLLPAPPFPHVLDVRTVWLGRSYVPIPYAGKHAIRTGVCTCSFCFISGKTARACQIESSTNWYKFYTNGTRQIGYTVEQLKAKFNVPALESLTKTQCSRAIDELNGKAA